MTASPDAAPPAAPFTIVGIGGTTRDGSSGERMVRAVLASTERLGARTRMFGGAELALLPHFAPESSTRTPAQQAFVDAVRGCHGLVIGSPGYHGGVSGLVKNALDLLEDLRTDERPYFERRPVGLVVVAAGWQACGVTLQALRGIVHAMRGWPTPIGIIVNTVEQRPFDDHGQVVDARLAAACDDQAAQIMFLARAAALPDPAPDWQDRLKLLSGADMWTTAAAGDAPSIRMADGPMGVASGRVDERDVSVLTPAPVALGASWDVDLVRRVGAVVGADAARKDVRMMLAPNLNLPRSPLAGRAFEMFAEDPYLAGTMGVAWMQGLQDQGVGACPKHLVCNDSETQRHTYDAVIDAAPLREIYLRPFEMAVQAGCPAIMTAYNRLNGADCVSDPFLLQRVLRQDWGFEGVVMSDWFGTRDGPASVAAGLDLEMPGPARAFGDPLRAAVQGGQVAPARIVQSAGRVAAMTRAVAALPAGPTVDAQAVLVEAAAAGMTLLRNQGSLLPAPPGAHRRIAVIGPNAEHPCYQGGTFAKIAVRPDAPTPLDSLRRVYAGTELLHAPGVAPDVRLPPMVATPLYPAPDGATQGMTVDYFADAEAAGPPLLRETRATNRLVFFGTLPGGASLDQPRTLRAAGRFTPAETGAHQLHVGGTGRLHASVDGTQVYRRDTAPEPADIMGVLIAGDSQTVTLQLTAGVPVDVVVQMHTHPARAHGVWFGIGVPQDPAVLLDQAVHVATQADLVLLFVGETPDSGVESRDRTSTHLPQAQRTLIARVAAANPRCVVIANVGHAFDLSWDELVPAVLLAWYPGEAFGTAIAEVLSGVREPGGRLAVSIAHDDADYPAYDLQPDAQGRLHYTEDLRLGYRGIANPRYAFGAGQGYTHFDTEALAVHQSADGLSATVRIRNQGKRPGKHVVQVYARQQQDVPVLAGFQAVTMAPGERRDVHLPLDTRVLQRWDDGQGGWRTRPGRYEFSAGPDCRTIAATAELLTSA